jgi:TRAP-type C4-dicarboxylate transport system substrate-binding protein
MSYVRSRMLFVVSFILLITLPAPLIAADGDLPKTHFKVVGTWNALRQFDLIEQPYFTKIIPERSRGQITVDFVSTEELGLKGYEIIRLMKQGMLDIADASTQYVGGDEPFVEGLDLGYNDVGQARRALMAYKPLLDQRLQKKFNLKLVTLWPFAAQISFCRSPIAKLTDL